MGCKPPCRGLGDERAHNAAAVEQAVMRASRSYIAGANARSCYREVVATSQRAREPEVRWPARSSDKLRRDMPQSAGAGAERQFGERGRALERGRQKKSPNLAVRAFSQLARQRPTLPHSNPCSTIGSEKLDFRVRKGIGYGLLDITTGKRWAPELASNA